MYKLGLLWTTVIVEIAMKHSIGLLAFQSREIAHQAVVYERDPRRGSGALNVIKVRLKVYQQSTRFGRCNITRE